ncbi:YciI family protein [Pseudarthrobacter sp. P1]|uniref:YciI family protein n=1 Tax=Pseudarthrobacter sp. P1 TaxID=3418418 RepID=UPI003CEAC1AA
MSVYAVEYVYAPEEAQIRDDHRPAHRAWLSALVESGNVLASGPFGDGAGALLIFQAEDESTLNQILSQDPFSIAGGIAGAKITEWNPVIGHLAALVK